MLTDSLEKVILPTQDCYLHLQFRSLTESGEKYIQEVQRNEGEILRKDFLGFSFLDHSLMSPQNNILSFLPEAALDKHVPWKAFPHQTKGTLMKTAALRTRVRHLSYRQVINPSGICQYDLITLHTHQTYGFTLEMGLLGETGVCGCHLSSRITHHRNNVGQPKGK